MNLLNILFTVGLTHNGKAGFSIDLAVHDLTLAQMQKLRAMLPVAIGALENSWRDAQMQKPAKKRR